MPTRKTCYLVALVYTLCLLGAFGTTCTFGQSFTIPNDFSRERDIPVAYLIDSTRTLTFEQVQALSFAPTRANTRFGFVHRPVWVRIELENRSDYARFLLRISNVDTLECWLQRGEQWEYTLTGNRLPFATRLIEHRNLLFELPLPPNERTTVYLRIRSLVQLRLEMELWEGNAFAAYDDTETLFYGVLYGAMLLMFLYNFLIWLRIRDKTYFYYVLFAAFMFMTQFSIYEFAYQYWFGNLPFFNNSGVYVWVGATNFAAANFARHFLDVARYSKRWSNVLRGVSGYGIVIMGLSCFLDFPTMTQIVFLCNPLYTLFLVITSLIFWYKGSRFAPFFALAWSAYIAGLVVMVLYNRGLIPYSFWVEHSMQSSTLVEIVVLSLAISYKHKIMDKEAQNAQLTVQRLRFEQAIQEEEKLHLEETLAQQEQIHKLQQEKLQVTLDAKQRELVSMTIQMAEKNQLIEDIQRQLHALPVQVGEEQAELKILTKQLQEGIDLEADWHKFSLHFEQVHPDFFRRLSERHANLSANDLKVAAYLRISLGTKEIARLLNIDPKSVKMTKYRLKKKLALDEDEDLEVFLRTQ